MYTLKDLLRMKWAEVDELFADGLIGSKLYREYLRALEKSKEEESQF